MNKYHIIFIKSYCITFVSLTILYAIINKIFNLDFIADANFILCFAGFYTLISMGDKK